MEVVMCEEGVMYVEDVLCGKGVQSLQCRKV